MASVSLFTAAPGQAILLLCLFQRGAKNTAILWIKPGGGHGNPLQCSCLESPHGQRSLVGHSPRGRRESDTTERLSTAQMLFYLLQHIVICVFKMCSQNTNQWSIDSYTERRLCSYKLGNAGLNRREFLLYGKGFPFIILNLGCDSPKDTKYTFPSTFLSMDHLQGLEPYATRWEMLR